MEIKKFNEYSKNEQSELLMHWWYYYGKMPITLAEQDKFMELVEQDPNLIKNVALIAYARGEASQGLVQAIRRSKLEGFLDNVREISTTLEFEDYEEELESEFIKEMVGTINKPEPNVPMSEEQILETLRQLSQQDDAVLTSDKVIGIYKECLMHDDEVKNNEPLVDFTMAEGLRAITVFNTERLNSRKSDIIQMVDELPNIDAGPSFLALCMDKNGRQWTGDHGVMDLLVQLGIGVGALSYCLPRDMWTLLPGQVPMIIRNREKEQEAVAGNKPQEYQKVCNEILNLVNGKSEN